MITHLCPVKGCGKRVPLDQLMDKTHWYMVPKPLRNAVWAAWQDGEGAGSPQHDAAVDAAVRAVERKLA